MNKSIISRWLACLLCLALWTAALPAGLAEAVPGSLEAPVGEQAPFELSGGADTTYGLPPAEVLAEAAPAEAEMPPEASLVLDSEADAGDAEPEAVSEIEALPEIEAELEIVEAPEAELTEDAGAVEVEAETLSSDSQGGRLVQAALDASEPEIEPEDALVTEDVPDGAEASDAAAPTEEAGSAEDGALMASRISYSGLSLSDASLTLGVKETYTLKATLNGSATKSARFSSSNAKVAKVTSAGKITAKKAGTATITVVLGDERAECTVKVLKTPGSVKLSASKATLGVGERLALTATLPSKTASAITWKSSKAKVAKVSADGEITAVAKGTAKITATTFNGKTATCKVTVKAAPTSVSLDEAGITLSVGQSRTVSAKVKGGSGAFTLSVSGSAASLSGNTLTAVRKGTARLTAATYNGLKATMTVKVVSAPRSIELPQSTYALGVKEKLTLVPVFNADVPADLTYKSSSAKVAKVSAQGVVTAVKAGTAKITVTTHNGLSASCQVRVYKAPGKVTLNKSTLKLSAGEVFQLTGTLPKNTTSALSWKSSNAKVAQVDGTGLVTAVAKGTAKITVSTFNDKRAVCKVTVTGGSAGTGSSDAADYKVKLSDEDAVLLSVGSSRTISATVTPKGYAGAIRWSASSSAVELSATEGSQCKLTARAGGEVSLTAQLENGAYAGVKVIAVDTADLSDASFALVQKALLSNEALLNGAEGGGIIWDMIEAKLVESGISESRSALIVEKVKAADPLYRDIYIYALGAYDIVGDATRDKRGWVLGVSQFMMSDDTLYLTRSSATDESYAYTAMHETGHAIDYNAMGEGDLASENDRAVTALKTDVRNLLLERVDDAASALGLDVDAVDVNQVLDALLDHRTLLHEEEVMSLLTPEEESLYGQLADDMAAEMNATLPMNNGTMVWDAIEGVTNYAISGQFGHAYLLNYPQYQEQANYYYYDRQGNPQISAEPWAEFFSANILQDVATIAANLTYLPETCRYFAEELAPTVLNYFKGLVKGK